jgi:sulfur carrier protein
MEKELSATINGSLEKIKIGCTVAGLLSEKKIDFSCVVVEFNRVVIPQQDFGVTVVKDGDSVEILHFVGGG